MQDLFQCDRFSFSVCFLSLPTPFAIGQDNAYHFKWYIAEQNGVQIILHNTHNSVWYTINLLKNKRVIEIWPKNAQKLGLILEEGEELFESSSKQKNFTKQINLNERGTKYVFLHRHGSRKPMVTINGQRFSLKQSKLIAQQLLQNKARMKHLKKNINP